MTPEAEITALKERVSSLERILNSIYLGDRLIFPTQIELRRDVGTMLGMTPEEKMGFWGTLPVAQPTVDVGTNGHFGGGGTAVRHDDQWAGDDHSGGARWSIPGIVSALKYVGILRD